MRITVTQNRIPLIKAIHQRLLAEKSKAIRAEERKGEKA